MAKNLKLHIKNAQLADAIDLQGLKAKLSKKKETSSTPVEDEKVFDKEKPRKKTTKKKEDSFETKEVPSLSEATVQSNLSGGSVKCLEEKQEYFCEAPTFSTLQEGFIEKEASLDKEVSVSEETSLVHEQPSLGENIESVATSSENVSQVALSPEEPLEAKRDHEKKNEKPQKVLEETVEPSSSISHEVHIKKPFLSALRVNPENLGPVLQKKTEVASSSRSFQDRDQKRRSTRESPPKLWEPLKTSQGSRYQTFASHGSRPPAAQSKQPSEGGTGEKVRENLAFDKRTKRPVGRDEKRDIDNKDKKQAPFRSKNEMGQHAKERTPHSKKEQSPEPPPLLLDEDGLPIVRRKPPKEIKEKEKEKEVRANKKTEAKVFDDSRLRRGLAVEGDEEGSVWRKRRSVKTKSSFQEIEIVRPKEISVRLPISVKDLAQYMKLKSSQLISKLFLSGVIVTLNDILDDETTVQLLGEEFGCVIHIDTVEEERLRITDKSIRDEIADTSPELLETRPPIVAFMGHVDHGKTSIIDKIRKSNRVQSEVGAITQHIGAFVCATDHGPVTILDTPGHEAFYQMRERGADVTDIVVLVVAGDEGMKEQTIEAMNQAKESHSTIVVAINKCDKPSYDESVIFRQLAEHNLLPEAWGGQTVTVRCSALTGEGIDTLLEMLALQAEILELKASPSSRARGSVIETEMNKGLGAVATLLVRNGTLRLGDALVFETSFAKVKSMRDERDRDVLEAGPSCAVRIHGLSSMPSAGEEFIVVSSERDAREIAEGRLEGKRQSNFQVKRRKTLESMMEQASQIRKKELNIIVRADVQGSLEALCHALSKISSDKIELNILSTGIGEISESDVQLAIPSKAVILGYHTQVEAHAELMIKEAGVQVRLHSIIYHAIDDVRDLMKNALDKIREEVYKGKAEVKTLFKSSHLGNIAGCIVLDGTVSRNSHVRVRRGESVLFEGTIASLKRFKEDVREVSKGTECGIVLNNWNDAAPGDILEAFDVSYRAQEL